jgi:hypothetical protein
VNTFLALLLAVQIPAFFVFAVSVFFLGRKAPAAWLPRFMALEFPVLAAGALGLPLAALWALLRA